MNLLKQGLETQSLISKANAEALSDADVKAINKAGLRLVHRPARTPDEIRQQQDERRIKFVSAEAGQTVVEYLVLVAAVSSMAYGLHDVLGSFYANIFNLPFFK